MSGRIPRSTALPRSVLPMIGGVVLLAMVVLLVTSGIEGSTRVYGLVAYAALGLALCVAVKLDARRVRKRGHLTLTSTPRLRVVPATLKRIEGFTAICDPVTVGHMGWTADDVTKLSAQFKAGRPAVRLVLERRTSRVIGCVMPKRVGNGFIIVGWIGAEYRRQGYGSELLDQMCADAFAAGCRSVLIAVPAADPQLAPFLAQRQFVAAGTHKLLSLHDTLIDTLTYRRMPAGEVPQETSP